MSLKGKCSTGEKSYFLGLATFAGATQIDSNMFARARENSCIQRVSFHVDCLKNPASLLHGPQVHFFVGSTILPHTSPFLCFVSPCKFIMSMDSISNFACYWRALAAWAGLSHEFQARKKSMAFGNANLNDKCNPIVCMVISKFLLGWTQNIVEI